MAFWEKFPGKNTDGGTGKEKCGRISTAEKENK
jgi:hypothetical protein